MKIKQQVLTIHQLDIKDVEALEHAYKIVDHLQDTYGASCVMMSPNDGECVSVDELARVKGILSFIMCNRVVEVNPPVRGGAPRPGARQNAQIVV